MSTVVYLSLGSNLGDRGKNIRDAISALPFMELNVSPLYETQPYGVRNQPWFYNCVVQGKTDLSPHTLHKNLQQIEKKFGRDSLTKGSKKPRTLDIDILFYGTRIVHKNDLEIPHPRLAKRRFVLVPLAKMAPNFAHPVLKKSIRQLLKECTDTLIVRPL